MSNGGLICILRYRGTSGSTVNKQIRILHNFPDPVILHTTLSQGGAQGPYLSTRLFLTLSSLLSPFHSIFALSYFSPVYSPLSNTYTFSISLPLPFPIPLLPLSLFLYRSPYPLPALSVISLFRTLPFFSYPPISRSPPVFLSPHYPPLFLSNIFILIFLSPSLSPFLYSLLSIYLSSLHIIPSLSSLFLSFPGTLSSPFSLALLYLVYFSLPHPIPFLAITLTLSNDLGLYTYRLN